MNIPCEFFYGNIRISVLGLLRDYEFFCDFTLPYSTGFHETAFLQLPIFKINIVKYRSQLSIVVMPMNDPIFHLPR